MPSPLSHRPASPPDDRPSVGLLISSSGSNDAVRLSARGEIDLTTAPLLEKSLRAAMATADAVELDMRGVSFMDSQGLRALLLACDRPPSAHRLMVVNPSTQVRRVLELAGVAETLGLR